MANRSIGVLTLDLVAKIGGFTEGLSKAEREAKKRSDSMAKQFRAMGTAIAGAVTAAAATMTVLIKQSIDLADQTQKTAQAIGINGDALQELRFAADLSGVSSEQLNDTLKDLAKNLSEAAAGGKSQADAFKLIGVSATDAEGNVRPLEDVLLDIADRFAGTADDANKTALAMKIFGEQGRTLIPMLNSGRDGLEGMMQMARDLGLVMDEETRKAAERFNDSLTILQAQQRGVINQITVELLPAMNALSGLLLDVTKNTGLASAAGRGMDVSLKLVASAAVIGAAAYDTLLARIKAVGTAISLLSEGEFRQAAAAIKDGVLGQFDSLGDGIERVKKIWDGSFEEMGSAAAGMAGLVKPSIGAVNQELDKTGKSARGAADEVGNFIRQLEFSVATLGMTADETDRYRLAMAGASQAQLDYVASLQARVEVDRLLGEMMEQETAYLDDLNWLMTQYDELITGASRETLEYSKTLADLNTLLQAGKISQDEFNAAVGRAEEAASKAKGGFENFSELAMEAAKRSQGAFADFLFDPFGQGLKGMLQGFADTLQRMAAEAAAAKIFESLLGGSGGGGILGGIGSAIGGFFGGGRANGGPVWAGGIFEVGEFNRPELLHVDNKQYLIPGNQGQVTPMGSGTMGGSVTQVFNVNTPNPDAFRLSERQMMRRARQGLA